MTRRGHISWKTKYAAALRLVGDIPYSHAKLMHEDQIISLFEVAHGILHAVDPIDEHWNLTPMLKSEHKADFAKDNTAAKKVTRMIRANDAAVNRLLAKATGEAPAPRTKHRWPKRELRSRNTFQRRST